MKKKKGLRIALYIVLGFFVALGVFLLVWYFGASYPEFDKISRKERAIPGLESGLSPQGLCPLPENAGGFEYAMSGYTSGEPSRIYLIGESAKYVTLTVEGKDVKTHFGGITYANGHLLVASSKEILRFPLASAVSAQEGAKIEVTDTLVVEDVRGVAFCYYFDGTLYAGEFYRPGNYETDETHHMSVDGETNYGLIFLYHETQSGFEEVPHAVISVREQVQGIAVWDEGIALSTSYGLPDSKIFIYENILRGNPQGEYKGNPLYRLDSSNCKKVLTAPCMSEELFYENGRLYILFESLSNKYKYFVRRRIDHILSVALSDVLA